MTISSLGEAAGSIDAFVIKLLSTGSLDTSFNTTGIKQLGFVSMGAAANNDEQANGLALDSSGNIYITGSSSGSLGEANGGFSDMIVVKLLPTGILDTSFSSTGIKQFGSITLGTGASGSDMARGICVDSSGTIFLGGTTTGEMSEENLGGTDAVLIRLEP